MNQFKNAQVILLPTNNAVNALKGYNDNSLLFKYSKEYKTIPAECDYVSFYHLYIISDDETQNGDWVYYKNGTLEGIHQIINGQRPKTMILKKVIATTDTSLSTKIIVNIKHTDSINFYLPQPSQQFIEKYIKSYNQSSVESNNITITDVLVEYTPSSITLQTYSGQEVDDNLKALTLKINPDNTINIKSTKDSWNREEIDFKLNTLLNEILISKRNLSLINNPNSNKIDTFLNKWIEQNL